MPKRPSRQALLAPIALAGLLLAGAATVRAQEEGPTPYCGDEGVWIQILGAGGPELDDGDAAASYTVFVDDKARLLVDAGPGSSVNFDNAGGQFADLEAMVFTKLLADHAGDLPAYVAGSHFSPRQRPLQILGPDGGEGFPGTETFVQRLIGPEGAFPYLAPFLDFKLDGYYLKVREIAATGRQRWSGFASDHLKLAATPVYHGGVPGLAWRAEFGDMSVVFTGDFSNQKDLMADFAAGADALVIHHAIPESARGEDLDLHVKPSEIGRIAARADVRMVILGQRMNRTRGVESLTRQAIREHYDGPLIFADDQECWGL